jgi:hypothetical protein
MLALCFSFLVVRLHLNLSVALSFAKHHCLVLCRSDFKHTAGSPLFTRFSPYIQLGLRYLLGFLHTYSWVSVICSVSSIRTAGSPLLTRSSPYVQLGLRYLLGFFFHIICPYSYCSVLARDKRF